MKMSELSSKVMEELKKVFQRIDEKEVDQFTDTIVKAKRVFLVGGGREGLSLKAFAMRLTHLGKTSHWIWDDTTPAIGKDDLLIATSGGGYVPSIHHVVVEAKKAGATIAVVTANPVRETPQLADVILNVPAAVYRGGLNTVPSIQPMGCLFEQSLYICFDLLVLLLADKMKVTGEEMEHRHRNVE
ncbi:MAG: SIS domain-containing protein [Candidatus Atribacteria bacterium]|nr:SIS domain-containing protein [Candidatus Atribacteria bacterium]